jgi:hypothetical protein
MLKTSKRLLSQFNLLNRIKLKFFFYIKTLQILSDADKLDEPTRTDETALNLTEIGTLPGVIGLFFRSTYFFDFFVQMRKIMPT